MKFTLRSLGRLREATIDLGKDLIVLTGPNNTSKTYVAHTMYGFFETYFPRMQRAIQSKLVFQEASDDAIEIDVIASVADPFDAIISDICIDCQRGLSRILACDPAFTAATQIALEFADHERESVRRQLIEWSSDDKPVVRSSGMAWVKRSGDARLFLKRVRDRNDLSVSGGDSNTLAIYASIMLGNILLAGASLRALTLPKIFVAERAAIQLFSKELSQRKTEIVYEMLDAQAEAQSEINLLEKRTKRYSMPIRDSLQMAQDLAELKRQRSEFAPFADELEQQLLEGIVRVSDDGEMSFQPAGMTGNLEMHLSSSSVKALAPLVFYLRHAALKGHFLIIDEPELNLHPDNQRKVARLLGRLARNGIKVLISTHSDYVIREINNLIMLDADVHGDLRRKYGYRDDETLSPSCVGAYIFDATTAHEIPVRPTGIEVETIDREINRLNQVSQDLFFSLFPDAS